MKLVLPASEDTQGVNGFQFFSLSPWKERGLQGSGFPLFLIFVFSGDNLYLAYLSSGMHPVKLQGAANPLGVRPLCSWHDQCWFSIICRINLCWNHLLDRAHGDVHLSLAYVAIGSTIILTSNIFILRSTDLQIHIYSIYGIFLTLCRFFIEHPTKQFSFVSFSRFFDQ